MPIKSVALFHPFTAQAVGLDKNDLINIHSRSHIIALREISKNNKWNISVNYLHENARYESYFSNGVSWKFWPLSFRFRESSTKYRKQWSLLALVYHFFNTPSLLILNFSGLGSKFAQCLAKISFYRNKKYMVMIGRSVNESPKQIKFLREATQIFVHSENQLEKLRNGHHNLRNVTFLPLGVDTKIFEKNLSISKDSEFPKLLFVGRIVSSKGISSALEAFNFIHKDFPNSTLNIIGPCSDIDLEKKIKDFIYEKGLSKAVNLHGVLPFNELPYWYQNSDLLIFPSSSESFGMVIIESMACGTPVLGLKGSGGPDEIIINNKDGLLVDPENLKDDLLVLLHDKEKLEKMRHAAAQRVREFYSIECTRQILEEAIIDILKN